VVYSSGRATIQPTLGIHQLATTHAARSWVGWDQTPPGGTYHPRPYILDNTGGMAGLSGQLCKQTCSFGNKIKKLTGDCQFCGALVLYEGAFFAGVIDDEAVEGSGAGCVEQLSVVVCGVGCFVCAIDDDDIKFQSLGQI